MWNPLGSLQGLMSRKQKTLLDRLKAKAAAEGKTAYGKMEELAEAYVAKDKHILKDQSQERKAKEQEPEREPPLVSEPAPAISPGEPGTLQFELEKTKAVLNAAFEISDMLRPEPEQAPAPTPEAASSDQMFQTILTAWIQGEQAKKQGNQK